MSFDYWEDLSIWQARASQRWRGLMSFWKGHESSEAFHPIRKEICHEMKVITQCCWTWWERLWPLKEEWFNAGKLTLHHTKYFESLFCLNFIYILFLLLKTAKLSLETFVNVADDKFWCFLWHTSLFYPVQHHIKVDTGISLLEEVLSLH